MRKKNRQPAIEMDIVVDGNPLQVVAKPYLAANDQPRFRVSSLFEWWDKSEGF